MKTKHLIILLLIITVVGVSCRNTNSKKAKSTGMELVEPVETDEEIEMDEEDNNEIFSSVDYERQVRKPPFRDSTNFDNYRTTCVKLYEDEIETLNLKELIPVGEDFMYNYVVDWNSDFYAIAITYQRSEMELATTLFTYKDNKFIDRLDVAYDEIAESWFSKESDIFEDHIVVMDFNFVGDEPEITKQKYKVNSNGKFTKVSE